ncbi:uncharacterized protein HaLaN_01445 [Haematococcus lacustris]|uniref:F-box domain-containing protein n=1 Tax=Haematococcus lacustris TaxID=44745 RepID=A0A699Y9A3_HAELA|nr:uncharacterized protein HaLaN_01445 [Haematococcus lacustris]
MLPRKNCEQASEHAWAELSTDALAVVINSSGLQPRDVAAMRATCSSWRQAVELRLQGLAPGASTRLDTLLSLANYFPALTRLDLSSLDHREGCAWGAG